MRDLNALFADYSECHRTAGNKLFHRLGIPLIVLSLLGMLARVTLFRADGFNVDLGIVLLVASAIFYVALDWKLGAAMTAVTVAFYLAGRALPMWLNVALFVLGWIFQFIGHAVYEKNSPAFARNLVHLLVGPLWILKGIGPSERTDPAAALRPPGGGRTQP
jgi:uncharacterized membrane protein YGL010W